MNFLKKLEAENKERENLMEGLEKKFEKNMKLAETLDKHVKVVEEKNKVVIELAKKEGEEAREALNQAKEVLNKKLTNNKYKL